MRWGLHSASTAWDPPEGPVQKKVFQARSPVPETTARFAGRVGLQAEVLVLDRPFGNKEAARTHGIPQASLAPEGWDRKVWAMDSRPGQGKPITNGWMLFCKC